MWRPGASQAGDGRVPPHKWFHCESSQSSFRLGPAGGEHEISWNLMKSRFNLAQDHKWSHSLRWSLMFWRQFISIYTPQVVHNKKWPAAKVERDEELDEKLQWDKLKCSWIRRIKLSHERQSPLIFFPITLWLWRVLKRVRSPVLVSMKHESKNGFQRILTATRCKPLGDDPGYHHPW